MPRVHTVVKARKDQRQTCATCGKAIQAGDRYKWAKLRVGRMSNRKVWCADHSPKRSQLTSSHHLAALYDAEDAAYAEVGNATDVDALTQAVQDFGAAVREIGEGYTEAADNIVDGFGHDTYVSDELREKGEGYDGWADDLEGWDAQDAYDSNYAEPDREDYDSDDDYQEAVEDAETQALDAARSEAEDQLGNSPV